MSSARSAMSMSDAAHTAVSSLISSAKCSTITLLYVTQFNICVPKKQISCPRRDRHLFFQFPLQQFQVSLEGRAPFRWPSQHLVSGPHVNALLASVGRCERCVVFNIFMEGIIWKERFRPRCVTLHTVRWRTFPSSRPCRFRDFFRHNISNSDDRFSVWRRRPESSPAG
jgi:hypothetical protein